MASSANDARLPSPTDPLLNRSLARGDILYQALYLSEDETHVPTHNQSSFKGAPLLVADVLEEDIGGTYVV